MNDHQHTSLAVSDEPIQSFGSFKSRLRHLCCVAVVAGLTGCWGEMKVAPVSGIVTLDGQPLERASVFFQPEKGRPSFGVTDARGSYTLNYSRDQYGAEVGPGTVKISTGTQAEEDEGKVNKPDTIKGEKVPNRYAKEPIQVKVEPKKNKIDFKLTTNP